MTSSDTFICIDQSNNFNKIFLPLGRELQARSKGTGLEM